ncbi:MAG TPA: phytanoyl-CoA dioxygenase family protein [Chloroflexia bacterium]|nr:phytanoyl-CoA dioxygenase family protein [Chloroflexia bacterium]
MANKLSQEQIEKYAQEVREQSFCIIPGIIPTAKLDAWSEAFKPLLEQHIEKEGHLKNRGPSRYYVTLPFVMPFADPEIFENDDLLAIVENLVGKDGVMCQLATDTPLRGSDYQDVHRDTPPLFPEWGKETPPFQLALNFPLVDVTPENGPIEIVPGSHMISKEDGLRRLEAGELKLQPYFLHKGDVMIRDVRHLHRGTPNNTDTPRPMVVIGYSRRWLFRPEVSIKIPRVTYNQLSDRAKFWLRFNRVVETLEEANEPEVYQAFAY